jgi:AcrR family transcriptional regulator
LAEEIVAGAISIIERTGSDDEVTLRSVAREVGIAAPSIYPHFADREAILWAVVQVVFEEIRATVQAASDAVKDPVERLLAGCEAYVAFALDNPALYRALFAREFPEQAVADPDPASMVDQRYPPVGGEAFALLVEAIERCTAAGRCASSDPFGDATAVWVGLHGMVSLWSTMCDFPWPERHEFVRRLVLRLARVEDTA